jgi:predicted protein tyrosine phosphatase
MQIKAISRSSFFDLDPKELDFDKNSILSISSTSKEKDEAKTFCAHILPVYYKCIVLEDNDTPSQETIRDIFKWIQFVKANTYTKIYIHCDAGVSRSGAVAKFMQEYLHLDYEEFRRENPQIVPNIAILKALTKLAKEEISI